MLALASLKGLVRRIFFHKMKIVQTLHCLQSERALGKKTEFVCLLFGRIVCLKKTLQLCLTFTIAFLVDRYVIIDEAITLPLIWTKCLSNWNQWEKSNDFFCIQDNFLQIKSHEGFLSKEKVEI